VDIELSLAVESVDQAAPVEPLCVEPQISVRRVLELLKERRATCVLICSGGQLLGIFTERDALGVLARRGDLSAAIESLMTANPVTVSAEASIGTAIREMVAGAFRRLPLIERDGRASGVVQVSGIVHFLVEHFPRTIYNLPPVPHPVTHDREGS